MSIIATLSSDCIHRRCIGRDKCFAKKMIQSILACYLFFPVCVCEEQKRERYKYLGGDFSVDVVVLSYVSLRSMPILRC